MTLIFEPIEPTSFKALPTKTELWKASTHLKSFCFHLPTGRILKSVVSNFMLEHHACTKTNDSQNKSI